MRASRRPPHFGPSGPQGFTLMEMLVTLMLVALVTMLMFQMLGSYRIARERVQAQSGGIDRQALFAGWFRASVQGLFIDHGLTFVGGASSFAGTSLNPLYALQSTPTQVRWDLRPTPRGVGIVYVETGDERWQLALADTRTARFAYLDAGGRRHEVWPPKLGAQSDLLPSVVLLLRVDNGGVERAIAAAVLGPLKPVPRLTGEEEA